MTARWSEADPPRVMQTSRPDGTYVAALESVQYAIDIPTGECGTIALAYRAKDSESCYGWTNESYLHNFQHPSWKLDKGRHIARIRVVTAGREFVDAFKIINDAPFNDFRIEAIDQETKKKLK